MHAHTEANRGAFIQRSADHAEYVEVFGDIDLVNEAEFRESIARAYAAGRPVVVDLTRCTYISSRGLHVLFEQHERSAKGMLRINATPQIARLFDIVGLSQVLLVS